MHFVLFLGKIRDCFGLLGYLVHEWEDCSSTFLADIMVLYNKSRIMDDLTSFHFFVLSHGKAGKIQGNSKSSISFLYLYI